MNELPLFALTATLTALVSGNNLSASVGTLVGSRVTSERTGALVGALGFSLGLVLEGNRLNVAAKSLLPNSAYYSFVSLLVALLLFLGALLVRSPLSLTMALVGVAVGISERVHYHFDHGFLVHTVIAWVLAPVLGALVSYFANLTILSSQVVNPWSALLRYKLLLLFGSFFTSFTLGANTFGLIASIAGFNTVTMVVMVLSIFVGSLFLSSGILKRVGSEMYLLRYSNALVSLFTSSALVEAATLLGLPLSNTQTLTASVFGAGLSYRFKAIALRPFVITASTWLVAPLLGFLLGYLA
ncbi:anion permease [Candidatus Marsarchaeota G2 archaeon ECH_B_SAG-G16]|uniref:Anion permease n=5 Tax=Candidatus Marsarchaeota TaxID=1978152 RepID=A0A2R6AFL8_9ARCH|nr:MAG: anion permease [Candidatus Marsarchaeota G1 archaeon OSP_D]PSN85177.1 MAG: anion permease [Candidatus Marsarchaeota G1 archaeon BE_D]PSN88692.1 MAG: anion permease [Candidatus Marsarchaeota G1 archaeon OSP_C]PSN94496.1 MAG: anion permease [Candidatus Marsarchaeota G1 archaeon OSP_B]PSO04182.1 MAG: anion permease [Candidatus Marsarchaeota G2 archaeon ECH_B_SAG-G16]